MEKTRFVLFAVCVSLILAMSGCNIDMDINKTVFKVVIPDTYTAADRVTEKDIPADKPIKIFAVDEEGFENLEHGEKFLPSIECTGVTKAGGRVLTFEFRDFLR